VSGASAFATVLDFRQLDRLATGTSPLHRIDARAKVLVTLAYVVCVMSWGRYALGSLLPFAVFPLVTLLVGRVPLGFLARKLLLVLPIAVVIGLPNPFFDRAVVTVPGGYAMAGGWLSMFSIVVRTLLAASAAFGLVAVTGFPAVCDALERLGMPRRLAVQLLFVYRYLSVLGAETARTVSAREQRGAGRPLSVSVYGSLAGGLLLRTWDRAERVYLAMCARGYRGEVPAAALSRFGWPDLAYVIGWCGLFLLLRWPGVVDVVARLAPAVLR
jgi:cobalt/nickel transport system permease protein